MMKDNIYIRSSLIALVLLFGLGSSTLAGSLGYPGSRLKEARQAVTTVLHEDFEDDTVGPLGAPWSVTSAGSGSSVSIVNTNDHSRVLQLQANTAEGNYISASRPLSSSSQEITVQVDIKPSSGSSFIWSLHGAGTSIGRRRIRLQQNPGTTNLSAHTVPGGETSCGKLKADAWSKVTLIVHSGSRTFDVLINGAATSCKGISAGIQPPFNSVSVMDASNAGWGGKVLFDNIDVTTP
jgi:hypothetical protein